MNQHYSAEKLTLLHILPVVEALGEYILLTSTKGWDHTGGWDYFLLLANTDLSLYKMIWGWESHRGVVANVMDCGIVVNEFELQSRLNVRFWANTLWKSINPLIILYYWLNVTTTILRQGLLWHKIIHEGWYTIKHRSRNIYTKGFTVFQICCIFHSGLRRNPLSESILMIFWNRPSTLQILTQYDLPTLLLAQSVGDAENTDCISAEW